MSKPTMWFPIRSDAIRAAQAQKMARGWNFAFRKLRNCTICVVKKKVRISFTVTAKLICAFGFAYANCWFSCDAAQMIVCFCFFSK